MPKRIQMSRRRPWRAENPDAVIVARPSKWGNPFKITHEHCDEVEVGGMCWVVRRADRRPAFAHESTVREARAVAVEEFRTYLRAGLLSFTVEGVRAELAGKNLGCWCPLPAPGEPDICHASVLLEIANQGETR